MLVFGFVHYTDVRWTTIQAPPKEVPLNVVASGGKQKDLNSVIEDHAAHSAPDAHPSDPSKATDPNRVLSTFDFGLRAANNWAQVCGVIAGISLILMTMLGVLAASGGGVPGIEKAVTACVWSMILGLVCIPWRDVMPSIAFPGVFAGYDGMIAASEGWDKGLRGGLAVLGQFLVLPFISCFGAMMVCLWFRSGVEHGVVVTAVSELDEALEREMLEIRKRGVGGGGPRAVGALNRALGDAAPPVNENRLSGPLAGTPGLRDTQQPARSMSAGAPLMHDEPVEPPQTLRIAAGAEGMSRGGAGVTGTGAKPRAGEPALAPSLSRKPRRDDDDDRRPI
jgi:hypothetical protein